MTISYNLGIPASGNNPSVDQPNMLTNNDNIATYVAVDHIAFNTSGSGQHKQVTFNSNNVPALPTSSDPSGNKQGILFTNTVGAGTVNQLFFYAGTAAQSSTQYYVSSVGGGTNQTESSTFLLGGLILKTGTVQVVNGPTAVNFVAAFPNNCLSVLAQPQNSGAPTVANDYVYVSSPSVSGFNATATRRITLANNTVTFFYIAIGN